MPTAKAIAVAAASHGSPRLAKLRKRVGLARSIRNIGAHSRTVALCVKQETQFVVPAKAGTHLATHAGRWNMGPRFRGDDSRNCFAHSMPWRNAAAAAKGPSTALIKVSAHRIVNGVPNGTGPTIAAFEAATPKMSTGTVSGTISTAS